MRGCTLTLGLLASEESEAPVQRYGVSWTSVPLHSAGAWVSFPAFASHSAQLQRGDNRTKYLGGALGK